MSKIVWAIAVIFMMMATVTLASAAEASTEAAAKGVPSTDPGKISGGDKQINQAGKEYLLRAWGRYGPVSVGEGSSIYRRIYYTTIYGPFLGQPVLVDSLEVRYPQDVYTIYSLGTDKGYIGTRWFDARLATHDGSLTGAYIDYHAVRG